jgi:hypothetical protein
MKMGVEIIRFGDSSLVGSYAVLTYLGLYNCPKTSTNIYRQTWCNMPENWNRQHHPCDNVKPGIVNVCSVFFFHF